MSDKIIGIDFGTKFSYFLLIDVRSKNKQLIAEDLYGEFEETQDGKFKLISNTNGNGILTCYATTPEGEIIVGGKAALFREDESITYKGDLKKKLLDACRYGNDTENAKNDVKNFICGVFNKEDIDYSKVKQIIIGAPAFDDQNEKWGVHYNDILKEALNDIVNSPNGNTRWFNGGVKIRVEYEPLLAAYTALSLNNRQLSRCMCVIDIGAGTSDATILKKNNQGVYEHMAHVGGDAPGGNNYDAYIADQVSEELGLTVSGGDYGYREAIRRAKEYVYAARCDNLWRINKPLKELSAKETAYNDYDQYGRMTTIVVGTKTYGLLGDASILTRLNEESCAKRIQQSIPVPLGNIEPNSDKVVWINTSMINEQFKGFAGKLAKLFQTYKDDIETIIFVGGASRIDTLRQYLITQSKEISEKEVGGQVKYYINSTQDNKQIKVLAPAQLFGLEFPIGEMVAYGALYAYENPEAGSAPKYDGTEYAHKFTIQLSIGGQKFKEVQLKTGADENVCFELFPNTKDLHEYYKEMRRYEAAFTKSSKNPRLRFSVKIDDSEYPTRGKFWLPFKETNNLPCWHNEQICICLHLEAESANSSPLLYVTLKYANKEEREGCSLITCKRYVVKFADGTVKSPDTTSVKEELNYSSKYLDEKELIAMEEKLC